MKKSSFILKFLLCYVLGYIIFATCISLVEALFLMKLSNEIINFISILFRTFKGNVFIYSVVCLMILIFNILYNYISVRTLNSKLDKMKKG